MINIIIILISLSYITLLDRKLMGSYQRRLGSNIYGYSGIYQPILDGIKLIIKYNILPINSIIELYIISIILFIVISMINILLLPNLVYILSSCYIYNNYNILIYILLSSINIYCILIGGYSSHNIYSLLGCIRIISQLISYEIYISIIILTIVIYYNYYCIQYILLINIRGKLLIYILLILYIISILGECNRPPFDIGESESELVSGINTEYSSYLFSLYIIGEYINVLLLCRLISIIYYNNGYIHIIDIRNISYCNIMKLGYNSIYYILYNKIYKYYNNIKYINISYILIGYILNIFIIVIIRGIYVRIRQDIVIKIGWYNILPISILYLYYICIIIISLNIIKYI